MTTCRHCGRYINQDIHGVWADLEATGDDIVWRETCDAHDTFQADHEPQFVCAHCERPVSLHGAEWWSHDSLEDKDACGIRLMDRQCVLPYPEEDDEDAR